MTPARPPDGDRGAAEAIAAPPLWVALIPVVFLLATMGVSILRYGLDPQIPLAASAVVAALAARARGVSWAELEKGLVGGVALGLKPVLILLVIGILIAMWIAGGVVPYLVFLGLELIDPSYFFPTACALCAVISLSTGSSWTTAGTVGVALMGVGEALGLPPPMAAGAVVSGAYFGDKLSPLSDSTNLAPAVTGVELFVHIRHMLYTTLPALGAALVLYTILGYTIDFTPASAESVLSLQDALGKQFRLGPPLLLAPAAVVAMGYLKVGALPALAAAAGIGAVFAFALQGLPASQVVATMHYGYEATTGVEPVDELLSGGGLDSMMWTVSLILCALAYGGVLEKARMLETIAGAILRGVRSGGSLVAATVGTCIGMNVIAPDQYLSIIVPGRMYREAYLERGLDPRNLSRTVEDAGTLTSPLVPWNTCGATMMAALAVNPFAYLPYAFFNLLTPVVAILWAYLNIGQARSETEPEPGRGADDRG